MTAAADRGLYAWPTIKRPADPIEVSEDALTWWLTPSAALLPIPDLDRTSYVIFTPDDFDGWADLFATYNVNDYLGIGDFTAWGELTIASGGGTVLRSKTLRFFNPADDYVHPFHRVGANEVRLAGFSFEGTAGYWILQGISVRAPINNAIKDTAHHILLDRCHVQDSGGFNYGLRVLSTGAGNQIQNSVIHRIVPPGNANDAPGLQIYPAAGDMPIVKAVDCEIFNYADQVAISLASPPSDALNTASMLLDGCDLYFDETAYRENGTRAEGENCIDTKTGDPAVQTLIRRSRMWGCRRNAGSSGTGDCVVTHRYTENLKLEDCILADSAGGWREVERNAGTDLEQPRNIVLERVGFCDIRPYASGDTGACVQPMNNTQLIGLKFARSAYVAHRQAGTLRAGGPVFSGCQRVDTTDIMTPSSVGPLPYAEPPNTVGNSAVGYIQYERKRWTGREIAVGPWLTTDPPADAWVLDKPPTADFTVQAGDPGQVIIVSTAVAGDGAIVSHAYTFGDGGSSATANPSHTYSGNGVYSIRQTVTDANGLTDTMVRSVLISGLTDVITLPSFAAAGTLVHGVGDINPAWPPGHVAGQVAILLAEQGGEGVALTTLEIPAGFIEIGQYNEGSVNPLGTRISAFWCRADAATMAANGGVMPTPRVNDINNHQAAVILTFNNCIAVGSPVDTFEGSTESTPTTAVSIPGGTTGTANCYVLAATTSEFDTTAAQASGWTNAGLSGLAEIFDGGGDSGNGGVISVAAGGKAAAGAFGATTATLANAARQARMMIALKGAVA